MNLDTLAQLAKAACRTQAWNSVEMQRMQWELRPQTVLALISCLRAADAMTIKSMTDDKYTAYDKARAALEAL